MGTCADQQGSPWGRSYIEILTQILGVEGRGGAFICTVSGSVDTSKQLLPIFPKVPNLFCAAEKRNEGEETMKTPVL